MIIAIAGEKGGTGKTTIATNIAYCRSHESKDVIIVDTDPQGSASFWCGVREEENHEPKIYSIQKTGKGFSSQVIDLSRRYDDVIIDVGGRDSTELRESLTIADIVLIPIQASQYDIWTITRMDELVRNAKAFNKKLNAQIILNRASSNPLVKESEEAKEIIDDFEELNLIDVTIKDRIIYRKSASLGKSVLEMPSKDTKAEEEILALYRLLYGENNES
jgi:chromosome partitioning protein